MTRSGTASSRCRVDGARYHIAKEALARQERRLKARRALLLRAAPAVIQNAFKDERGRLDHRPVAAKPPEAKKKDEGGAEGRQRRRLGNLEGRIAAIET